MSEERVNDQMSRLKAQGFMGLSQVEDLMTSLLRPEPVIESLDGEIISLPEKKRQLLLKKAEEALGMVNVFINAYLSTEELDDRCGNEDICIDYINYGMLGCEGCRRDD